MIVTTIVALILLGLLSAAMRYGATTITEAYPADCQCAEDRAPDGDLTQDLTARIHDRHKPCPRCRLFPSDARAAGACSDPEASSDG